jgi:hypothetical protein
MENGGPENVEKNCKVRKDEDICFEGKVEVQRR